MKTIHADPALRERLLARMTRVGNCWEWALARNRDGYGVMGIRPHGMLLAHRVSYTAFVGPIPDGLVIDHLCRNRACINPDHLEPVTVKVNTLRGATPMARAVRTGLCIRGHELDPAQAKKECRPCHAIREREYRRRKRIERMADKGS